MEEMPSHNTTVLKIAILPLDLPCSGLVTHSREIPTTGKSHKRPYGLFAKDDTEIKKGIMIYYEYYCYYSSHL
jgi:hypothetical protein